MKIYEKDIIELICTEYAITGFEFHSGYRYGSLSEARQLYCLVLKSLGMRNMDITNSTGYSRPRVTIMLNTARRLRATVPYFRQKHDVIVQLIKDKEK